jgi:hypothetical protein
MADAPCEEKCPPIGIGSPHQRPNLKWLSIRRDELQANLGAGLKPYPRNDFRPLRANVYRLTRMATPAHFNEHGPRDRSPGMPPAFSLPPTGFTGRQNHSIT